MPAFSEASGQLKSGLEGCCLVVLNTMPGDAEVLYQITNLFWHLRRPAALTGSPAA